MAPRVGPFCVPITRWSDAIRLRVRTDPAVQGATVYLKAFDPDDPSANNDEVDADLDGSDNRGAAGTLDLTQGQTAGDGSFWSAFTVAHQPGDNHRVAGTLKQSALNMLNNNNVPPSGTDPGTQDQVALFPGRLSPVLTVWRKLHVETDSMARPTFPENTITTQWNEPHFPSGALVLDVDDQGNNEDFTNGWIRIQAAGFPDIVTRIITFRQSALDDEIDTSVTQAAWGARPEGGGCLFSDDDISTQGNFTAGALGSDIGVGQPPSGYLPLPNTSSLTTPYAPAYILPVVEGQYTTTTGIPFIKNTNPEDKTQWDPARLLRGLPVPTSEYWTAYVFSAFQAEAAQDADSEQTNTKGVSTHPDGSTAAFWTWGSAYTGMCTVFQEVLDDAYGVVAEQRTVAHEIAHCLGAPHLGQQQTPGDGGLMDHTEQGPSFLPESLERLRRYDGP